MSDGPNMDIAPRRKPTVAQPASALDQTKIKKLKEALGEEKEESASMVRDKKRFWKDWSGKQRAIFIVVVVAIVAAAGLTYWFGFAQWGNFSWPEITVENKTEEPSGPLTKSPLTGLEVTQAAAEQTPLAIVIENLTTVRPQSGLSRADVVYEFLAEGGITRFLAIFASNDVTEPDLIGPVRSLRAYMVPVGLELLAPVYHVGGAPNALTRAKEWGMRDVNQFFDSKYFWRDNAINGQGAPHNMWTRMPQAEYAVRDHGWPLDDGKKVEAWKFQEEATIDTRGNISTISVPFSSGRYNIVWEYDRIKNRFKRAHAGDPHLDRNNEEQLTARNVVIQYCQIAPIAGDDKGRLEVKNDAGEGNALIFNDGRVVEATWKKADRDARTKFYDRSTGAEIKFVPGNFWVEVMPDDKVVTWEEAQESSAADTGANSL